MSQTGVQTTPSKADTGAQLTIAMLEDTLYEMLAMGLDPCEKRVTQKEIQQFLYEHARSPKSREEFMGFFQSHGLSTEPDGASRPAAFNPLPDSADGAGLPAPTGSDRPLTGPGRGAEVQGSLIEQPASLALTPCHTALESPRGRLPARSYLLWGAVASVLIALGLVAGIGWARLAALSDEIEQTRAAQMRNREAVESVKERIDLIRSKADDTGDILADMRYKIDRVMETVVQEPTPEPPAEAR